MTDFDACKEVNENLKDGASVFIRGTLDYSSFLDNERQQEVFHKVSS